MKKLILLITLLSISKTFAQKEEITRLGDFDKPRIRYGFYLGLHQRGFQLKGNNAEVSGGAGFHLGVLADLRLNEHLSIMVEPGVISSTNKLSLPSENPLQPLEKFDLPTTNFHMPLSLKIRTSRVNNISSFLKVGGSYNHNFSSDKNRGEGEADPHSFLLKQHNFFGHLEIGMTIYFPYFKFTPSLKGLYGFNNEFEGIGSIAKSNITSLKTRGIFLSFTFQ